jgi:glutamyl/glutaminyl-tRNA synthetase
LTVAHYSKLAARRAAATSYLLNSCCCCLLLLLLLLLFHQQQAGSEEGLKNCLRFKLDMQAGNKALRDPVAFRCNLEHHWRTGHTYKVEHRLCCLLSAFGSAFGV